MAAASATRTQRPGNRGLRCFVSLHRDAPGSDPARVVCRRGHGRAIPAHVAALRGVRWRALPIAVEHDPQHDDLHTGGQALAEQAALRETSPRRRSPARTTRPTTTTIRALHRSSGWWLAPASCNTIGSYLLIGYQR